MRGRVGLVIGLTAGYILGARAGRERYEQIREQAAKVWSLPVVQKQVERAKEFGASALKAVPSALWDGAVKVVTSASTPNDAPQARDAAGDDTGN